MRGGVGDWSGRGPGKEESGGLWDGVPCRAGRQRPWCGNSARGECLGCDALGAPRRECEGVLMPQLRHAPRKGS